MLRCYGAAHIVGVSKTAYGLATACCLDWRHAENTTASDCLCLDCPAQRGRSERRSPRDDTRHGWHSVEILTVTNLSKLYGKGDTQIKALDCVSFGVEKGEFVAIDGFLTLITLIGVTNIVNTLDANIKLRRREIAMLKSVGLTPGGFLRMLRYESLFYGLTALLFGLPLGIALSVFIYSRFGGVSSFPFTLPWEAILACI